MVACYHAHYCQTVTYFKEALIALIYRRIGSSIKKISEEYFNMFVPVRLRSAHRYKSLSEQVQYLSCLHIKWVLSSDMCQHLVFIYPWTANSYTLGVTI